MSADPAAGKPLHKRLLGPPYRVLRERLWAFHPRRIAALLAWGASVAGTILRRRRDRRLTVGIDVSPLFEPLTGIGWYLYRLLEELAPREDLALRLYGPSLAADEVAPPPCRPIPRGPAIEVVAYPTPAGATLPRGRLISLLGRLAPRLIAADANRVIFAPNYLPSERFARARGALVATVHDLGYRMVPWSLQPETLERLEGALDEAWFRAARVITDSEAVAREMRAQELAGPGRVRVIPLGPAHAPPDPARLPPLPAGLRPPFGLWVGTLEPRKNLATLLEAWRLLRRRRLPEAPALVLVGRFGWKSEALRREVEAAEREGWLRHLGYLRDAELAALYRSAAVFVFPSLYEGFGLPVLEALGAGAPVVASDLPVLRELAGEAAVYAPPRDPEAWERAVERVLSDAALARRLGERGVERARRFTWAEAARRHVEVFRDAADLLPPTTPRCPSHPQGGKGTPPPARSSLDRLEDTD